MAVINDSGDKMRDIIAGVAANLEAGADPVETDDADGAADTASGADAGADGADAGADGADAGDVGGTGAVDEPVVADGTDNGDAGAAGAAGADAGTGKVGDTAAAAAAAGKVAADAAGNDKPKEDAFAKEHGVKTTDAMGRPNRIPYPVVRDRIVPNAIKKAQADWEKTTLQPVQARVLAQDKDLQSFRGVEKILLEEPRRYLAILQQSVPGYAQLFAEMGAGKFTPEVKQGAKPAVGTNLADGKDDPEPPMDAKDENGKVIGYTQAGYAAVRAWDRREAAREANKAMEARFGKVLTREERLQQDEAAVQTVDSVISGAAKWPGFMENHEAILTELGKGTNPLATGPEMQDALHAAYTSVMFGTVTKHKETEEESKKRHFAEFQSTLRRSPRSTSTTTQVARREPAAEVDANTSSEDRMRNIIADVASRLK
jgi:hypothetical protein